MVSSPRSRPSKKLKPPTPLDRRRSAVALLPAVASPARVQYREAGGVSEAESESSDEEVIMEPIGMTAVCELGARRDVEALSDVRLDWTVQELKQCIAEQCSSHPDATSQRLVIKGSFLDDPAKTLLECGAHRAARVRVLRRNSEIVQGHDLSLCPEAGDGAPLPVSVRLNIHSITTDGSGDLSVVAELCMQWTDERLRGWTGALPNDMFGPLPQLNCDTMVGVKLEQQMFVRLDRNPHGADGSIARHILYSGALPSVEEADLPGFPFETRVLKLKWPSYPSCTWASKGAGAAGQVSGQRDNGRYHFVQQSNTYKVSMSDIREHDIPGWKWCVTTHTVTPQDFTVRIILKRDSGESLPRPFSQQQNLPLVLENLECF